MKTHKQTFVAILSLSAVFAAVFFIIAGTYGQTLSFSAQEEGFDDADFIQPWIHPRLRDLETWQRPQGPLRVALQAGHWLAEEAPDEQENLRKNTGASAAGTTERDVNIKIVEETRKLIEQAGIIVDVLPVTVPPNYYADLFLSIHADGNANRVVSGYKAAAPRRDYTSKGQSFADLLEQEYEKATKLARDPNVTSNMRGYYAFNWRRYDHSLHPMTVAAILETGFITNQQDRKIIVQNPQKAAEGIANAILLFLKPEPQPALETAASD